jgi:ferritin
MVNAINEQINAEMYSAYFYLAMNSFFESKSLAGFSHWMRMQTQEEMLHAMKL